MAQIAKIVDITKSYLPIDPQAFAQNLSYTAQEDNPEKGLPIIAFEGYNFLPTSYGYRSYFGTETELTLDALPKLCDKIFMIQSKTYENMIVALCSDGVYTASVGSNAWTKILSLTDTWTASGIYSQYTFCIIENILYIYRQGHSHVLRIKDDLTNDTFIPSFLNMTGQMGIFRANGRLGLWDSEDSVAWSSAFDLTDFTPSIENLVGNSTFFGVLGRIVTIVPHGEGFIIYATKSVVGVSYSNSATNIWDAMVITSISGIAHPKAVCIGSTVKEHFVYTTNGIAKVGHFNALSRQYEVEYILPELYDFLKEARDPVAVECHAARFLHFCVVNPNYINGRTIFTDVEIPSLAGPVIRLDTSLWDSLIDDPYISPKQTFQLIDSFFVEPTGTLTVDRTADSHKESRWMATMVLPNLDYQATRVGLFQGSNALYKSISNITPALLEPNIIFPAADQYCIQHSNGGIGGGGNSSWNSWGFYIFSNIPLDTNKIRSDYVEGTVVERSAYKDLYSQSLLGLDSGGDSCIDLLYNFISAINEYRYFLNNNKKDMIDFTVDMINAEGRARTVYSDAYQNFSYPSIYSEPIYIPTDIGSIYINQRYGNAGAKASCSINYVTTEYLKLTHASASVVITDEDLVYFNTTPVNFFVSIVSSSLPTASSKTTITGLVTIDALLDWFGNPDLGGLLHSGDKYILVYTTSGVPPLSTDALYISYQSVCILQNTRTLAYVPGLLSARPVYDASENPLNTSHTVLEYRTGSMNAEQLLDIDSNQYVLDLSVLFSYDTNVDPALFTMSLQHYVLWHTIDRLFYSIKDNTSYRFKAATVSYYRSVDLKKAYITATLIRSSDLVEFPDVIVSIIYDNKVHKTVVEESHVFIPEIVNWSTLPAVDLDSAQLLFTETDRDQVVKSITGDYSRTNLQHFLTPSWSDPGIGQAITFTGLPSSAIYDSIIQNSSVLISQQCIPWSIIKNNSTSAIINGIDPTLISVGKLLNVPMPVGAISYLSPNIVCYGYSGDWDGFVDLDLSDFIYPGATYQLQDGVPVPGYPSYAGSIVFDLHLKKWGKNANVFKALLEFSPMNSTDNAVIPYTNFGMDSGIIKESKKISLFSQVLTNSMMRYGKFGLYRLGFTEALEFILHFRTNSTGSITVDGSIDGRDLDTRIQHTESFVNVRSHIVKCHVNAMWQTLTISGQFDLQFMEFRGIIAARR